MSGSMTLIFFPSLNEEEKRGAKGVLERDVLFKMGWGPPEEEGSSSYLASSDLSLDTLAGGPSIPAGTTILC